MKLVLETLWTMFLCGVGGVLLYLIMAVVGHLMRRHCINVMVSDDEETYVATKAYVDAMQPKHNVQLLSCKRCRKLWEPRTFNFHNLCDGCLALFDKQKMDGRFAMMFCGKVSYHIENSDDWVKANPYVE